LATGSMAAPPRYPIGAEVRYVTAPEVLSGNAILDGPVLLDDPVGGPVAVALAELLAARGLEVTIVTGDGVVGTQLGRTGDLARANGQLKQAGVGCHPYSVIRSVGGDGAVLDDVHTGEQKVVPCAAIVDCGHRLPEDALSWRHPHTVRAGDCVAPRTVLEAIREGRAAALALDEQCNAVPLQLDREASPA
ncbi:MAG: hypothetical protein ICV72_11355, partial [Aldersonia sp.]|nr:hypothetical protein [Aldersonia sp.]